MCKLGCIRLIIVAVGIIAGSLLISLGIGHIQMPDEMRTLIDKAKIPQPQILLIIIGVIIVVLSILSLLKIVQSSTISKLIFYGVMGVLVIGLLIIASFVFIRREQLYADADGIYVKAWDDRGFPDASKCVNSINQFLQCCGPNSPADYLGEIPSSCCEAPINDVCPVADIFRNGCRKALNHYVTLQANYFGYTSIIIAILLVCLLVEAFSSKWCKTTK